MEGTLLGISDAFDQAYPDGWWIKYGYVNEDFSDEGYKEFKKDTAFFRERIFDYLNLAILSGDYIQLEKFETDLKLLKLKPDQTPLPFIASEALQESINQELNLNIIQSFKIAITYIIDFIKWLQIKTQSNDGPFYQINSEISDLMEGKKYKDNTLRQLNFLDANINIARIDHFLTPSEEDFQQLLVYSHELLSSKKFSGNKYAIVLRSKCNYLLCKWILRKSFIEGPLYAVVNSHASEFTIRDYNEPIFAEWVNYLENHYEISKDWQTHIKQDFNLLKNKALSVLSLRQLHRLIKYYKDVNPNYSQIKAIRVEMQKRYEAEKGSDDKYKLFVLSIAVNYAINNEFSLLLDTTDVQIKTIDELYCEINDVQAETGIYNFFPQFKFSEFLIKKLKSQSKSLNMISDLSSQRASIERSKSIFADYAKNVSWTKKNYNYVFHLTSDECFVEVNSLHLKELFVASSFVMPLYTEGYIDTYEEFKKELVLLEATIETFENISAELEKIKDSQEEIESIKKDLNNREIKSIETLSIFTTIVTFVFASGIEFKFITQTSQAILFTLCLSISLGFFVFLVTLTRTNVFIASVRLYFRYILQVLLIISFLWFLILYAPAIKFWIMKGTPPTVSKTNATKSRASPQDSTVRHP